MNCGLIVRRLVPLINGLRVNFCHFKMRNVNATIHRSCARFRCLRVRTRNGHVLFIRRRVTSFLSICPYPTALRLSEHKQSNLLVVPRYLPDCESNLTLSVSSVKAELIRFIYPRINRVSWSMRLFYSSIEKWKMKGGIYYCKDSIGHEDIKDIKIATRYTLFLSSSV